jgi:DNA polymerase type B, organellar and viral
MGQTLRPFVFWDGEGLNENDQHPLALFGCSLGHRIKYVDLSTIDCLTLILTAEADCPRAIHVGYAFGYDVNMILKDLPYRQLIMLYEKGSTSWKGFNIEYIPKKWFKVRRWGLEAKIFDVFLFFNCRFATALRKYGIGTPEDLNRIDAGKEERPNFKWADIDKIETYWETELKYGVQLMDTLRDILYAANLRISSWHGPGALASYALDRAGTRTHMDRGIDPAITMASRYAMYGGRFQPFQAGYYEGPVYDRDINSAYAYAFSRLPDLSTGKWRHIYSPDPRDAIARRMGIYRIRRLARLGRNPMPLPHRARNGTVSFPPAVEGWYFAPEAATVCDDKYSEFLEAWVYDDDGTYPFQWVEDAYEQRLIMQDPSNYDPSEKALKWMLAALYGQCAQRTGWERTGGPPKWHQLEWAGTVTAECRAMVYMAARQAGSTLVSIDTDGFISLRPVNTLPNGCGNKLGQWKAETFTGILYLQNGIYWLRGQDGSWLPPKSRGIPRKKLEFQEVLPMMRRNRNLKVSQHMFIGFGLALSQNLGKWRQWVDIDRTITFGGNGKASHKTNLCPTCDKGLGWGEAMHPLMPILPLELESYPHDLPWLNATVPTEQDILKKWGIYDD